MIDKSISWVKDNNWAITSETTSKQLLQMQILANSVGIKMNAASFSLIGQPVKGNSEKVYTVGYFAIEKHIFQQSGVHKGDIVATSKQVIEALINLIKQQTHANSHSI